MAIMALRFGSAYLYEKPILPYIPVVNWFTRQPKNVDLAQAKHAIRRSGKWDVREVAAYPRPKYDGDLIYLEGETLAAARGIPGAREVEIKPHRSRRLRKFAERIMLPAPLIAFLSNLPLTEQLVFNKNKSRFDIIAITPPQIPHSLEQVYG